MFIVQHFSVAGRLIIDKSYPPLDQVVGFPFVSDEHKLSRRLPSAEQRPLESHQAQETLHHLGRGLLRVAEEFWLSAKVALLCQTCG